MTGPDFTTPLILIAGATPIVLLAIWWERRKSRKPLADVTPLFTQSRHVRVIDGGGVKHGA